jgi:hypothetical protein
MTALSRNPCVALPSLILIGIVISAAQGVRVVVSEG